MTLPETKNNYWSNITNNLRHIHKLSMSEFPRTNGIASDIDKSELGLSRRKERNKLVISKTHDNMTEHLL